MRSLADGLGKGMDTWLVTRKPIGLIEGQSDAEHVSSSMVSSRMSSRLT